MRGEKILTFINRSYENLCRIDEPIHFYDILIQIINENSNSQLENDMQHIFLLIHCRKADLISGNDNLDRNYVIEAINSYAMIILKISTINESRRSLINVEEIKCKIAELFERIELHNQAADIYTSIRYHESASNCHKKVLL